MADVSKIRPGFGVYDVDGAFIGRIVRRGSGRSLLQHGVFTKQLFVVDDDYVASVGRRSIHLSVTKSSLVGRHARLEDEPPYQVQEDSHPAT
jgi:hypothetical protein